MDSQMPETLGRHLWSGSHVVWHLFFFSWERCYSIQHYILRKCFFFFSFWYNQVHQSLAAASCFQTFPNASLESCSPSTVDFYPFFFSSSFSFISVGELRLISCRSAFYLPPPPPSAPPLDILYRPPWPVLYPSWESFLLPPGADFMAFLKCFISSRK